MAEYKVIADLLRSAGGRGLTCHEIAAKLRIDPKQVGKALSFMRQDLRHMNSERNGQRVIVWAGQAEQGQ